MAKWAWCYSIKSSKSVQCNRKILNISNIIGILFVVLSVSNIYNKKDVFVIIKVIILLDRMFGNKHRQSVNRNRKLSIRLISIEYKTNKIISLGS